MKARFGSAFLAVAIPVSALALFGIHCGSSSTGTGPTSPPPTTSGNHNMDLGNHLPGSACTSSTDCTWPNVCSFDLPDADTTCPPAACGDGGTPGKCEPYTQGSKCGCSAGGQPVKAACSSTADCAWPAVCAYPILSSSGACNNAVECLGVAPAQSSCTLVGIQANPITLCSCPNVNYPASYPTYGLGYAPRPSFSCASAEAIEPGTPQICDAGAP